jgi:hypothetical protein
MEWLSYQDVHEEWRQQDMKIRRYESRFTTEYKPQNVSTNHEITINNQLVHLTFSDRLDFVDTQTS